jgi:cytochrome c peroxidase
VYGRVGQRNAPAIINRVYGRTFFWDGRAPSLERQVVEPLLNASEMAGTPDAIVATVRSDGDYRRAFDRAFGRPPEWDDVARALASYVRTIRSGNSAYDRYQRGDRRALSSEQQQGMRLFLGRANCWECHSGPTLSDERFHNTGIAFRRRPPLDVGRFVVSKNATDLGAFKTPTLRDIARTAPYMHDGSIATLADVVDHYDRGGSANPNLDPLVKPLRLTVNDKRALVAFLRTLNGQVSEGK